MKDDVARFARDLLRMKAEIICSKYQPEIILEMSGIAYTQDAQFAPEAIALLKNEPLRNFSIDIQTDTLVELDEQTEKQSRMEFLSATSQFMEKAVQAVQVAPDMAPLAMQMLLFGIRGFKVGRELEGVFERVTNEMVEKAKQPQQQKPDPEQMKMQAEMQAKAQEQQIDMQKFAAEQQAEMQKHQAELQVKMQIEKFNSEQETLRQRERIAADIEIARMTQQTTLAAAQVAAETNTIEKGLQNG
jgi:hypothetical protein